MLIREMYSLWESGRGTRPRVALSPTRPQNDAGMRVDPPPSEDMPIGSMPAATAAAEPPEEPPGVRSSFQGLRVTLARSRYSVAVSKVMPNSGVVDLPMGINPALR